MFCPQFGRYVGHGDAVYWQQGGFDMAARVEFDPHTKVYEFAQPGWVFDPNDPDHGEENRRIIRAWEADEWYFGTVVVTATKNGIELAFGSLSGIDVNFPRTLSADREPNAYLAQVADELAPDVIRSAKQAIISLVEGLRI